MSRTRNESAGSVRIVRGHLVAAICAAAAGATTTVEQFYQAADEKLYEAKRAGCNKVCY